MENKINQKKILKTTLLNIDSSTRNINPKNIFKTDTNNLPNNPLYFTKDSNIISIFYPNHNLAINDNIAILNVKGLNIILINSFYLINNFNYLLIKLDNTYINKNYINYNTNLYINIELIDVYKYSNYYIDNIPFNYIIGIKKINLLSDLSSDDLIKINSQLLSIFGTIDLNIINNNCLLIKLPLNYINNLNYFVIQQSFKINYLHIGGIELGYINSNFPINNLQYQSCQTVYNIIDTDNIQIILNYTSFLTINSGGEDIQIFKIINTIEGYPNSSNYTIYLKKAFNNVTNIELLSTEIPYIDNLIVTNLNDKLYWQNIEDGDNIYSIILDQGNYTIDTLISKIQTLMNKTFRINNNKKNLIYNNFLITYDPYVHKIIFNAVNLINMPNCLLLKIEEINSELYYIINILHSNNYVQVNDIITISSSNNITIKNIINNQTSQIISIDQTYINKNHLVNSINIETESYNIILGKITEISTSIVNSESNGGESLYIQSNTKFRLLFNYQDTIGDILGFKNVGELYSITDFKSIIDNRDLYIYNNNLNSVGNQFNYTNGFINLSGNNNYILMYLNDIEYIYNNNLPSCFAKILLSGNPGDFLFNTFVQQTSNLYSKNFPINTLTYIDISFKYSNGALVNFRNINHSFTIKITEEITQNSNTNINSHSAFM